MAYSNRRGLKSEGVIELYREAYDSAILIPEGRSLSNFQLALHHLLWMRHKEGGNQLVQDKLNNNHVTSYSSIIVEECIVLKIWYFSS